MRKHYVLIHCLHFIWDATCSNLALKFLGAPPSEQVRRRPPDPPPPVHREGPCSPASTSPVPFSTILLHDAARGRSFLRLLPAHPGRLPRRRQLRRPHRPRLPRDSLLHGGRHRLLPHLAPVLPLPRLLRRPPLRRPQPPRLLLLILRPLHLRTRPPTATAPSPSASSAPTPSPSPAAPSPASSTAAARTTRASSAAPRGSSASRATTSPWFTSSPRSWALSPSPTASPRPSPRASSPSAPTPTPTPTSPPRVSISYTPMAPSDPDPTLYFVRLARVAVAGAPLAVEPEEYAALPTNVDTGTMITRLPRGAYAALSRAVAAALIRGRARAAPAYAILDTCFRGRAGKLGVPEVELAFEGRATMRLPAENVMVYVDSRTTCLAFAPAAGRVAIIGNRQQQTFRLVYDVERSRIGFAAAGCG